MLLQKSKNTMSETNFNLSQEYSSDIKYRVDRQPGLVSNPDDVEDVAEMMFTPVPKRTFLTRKIKS